MAGIGFQLRRILRHDTYYSTLKAYSYAGLISAGPWVISILAMIFLGLYSVAQGHSSKDIVEFQTSITYLVSSSLILSGLFQITFTHYVADKMFFKIYHKILPNFFGLLILACLIGGGLAAFIIMTFMRGLDPLYLWLMFFNFLALSLVWCSAVLLTSLKRYNTIVLVFFIGYAVVVGAGYSFRGYGLNGFLAGFLLGHIVLFLGLMLAIIHRFNFTLRFSFEFLLKGQICWALIGVGFFYYAGTWVDKYIFWFTPSTSTEVIGPLRASPIYDLPIFLAYLAIIPGMAVFLVRLETEFAEYYKKFYDYILNGAALSHIVAMRENMVFSARQGIYEIIKIQSIAALFTIIVGPLLLKFFGISLLYVHLLNVDVVGVGLQIVLLSLICILFYLDRQRDALLITMLFPISNYFLTKYSITLGPYFFGYGFAISLLITVCVALFVVNKALEQLEYKTFMLQ